MSETKSATKASVHPDKRAQIIRMILDGIVEAIEAGGFHGAPGGILYAALMAQGCTLNQFHSLMGILINAGRVELRGECYFVRTEGK